MLVHQGHKLEKCIEDLLTSESNFIACDTEFIRQKTFYPELCLIQCAVPEHTFLLDALALNADLFESLFFGHSKTLLFHSCKQDLEIVYHLYNKLPSAIFDSQVAGQFLGLGESIAYDGLVKHYLGLEIDKSQQHTDWKRRPLSPAQLDYAASDVIHLVEIYPKMIHDLREKGYLSWALNEMSTLSDTAPFEVTAVNRVARLNIPSKKHALAAKLLELREAYAKMLNVNRTHCLSDKAIESIAKMKTDESLMEYLHKTLHSFDKRAAFIGEIMACVAADEKNPTPPPQKMTPAQEKQLETLRTFRDEKADALQLPRTLLATSQDLKDYVLFKKGRIPTTWRREVFDGEII